MSSITGILSQVWALVRPSPAATVAERTTASVDRSLRTRPSTRWEMNGSTIAIRRWSARAPTAVGAGLEGGRGRGVVGVDPQQHLAALEAHPADRVGVVRR